MVMLKKIKYYTRENMFGTESEYAEFDGIEFYKNGYYYLNGKHGLMHRYIYSYYHGEIPESYDIHHKNHIKSDNNVNNLEAKPHAEHMTEHNKGKKHAGKAKQKIANVRKEKGFPKGNKHPQYKPRTPQMLEDIKNGIGPTEFMKKHNCGTLFYYNIKKEIAEFIKH